MTILITLGVILTLILGFSLSGLLVMSKLQTKNKVIKSVTFIFFGSVFSVFTMVLTIFIVWPT